MIAETTLPAVNRFAGSATIDGTGMRRANQQIRRSMAHIHWAEARLRRRRWIDAIDRALDRLEELHSADVATGPQFCRRLVDEIVGAAGIEPPLQVRQAATSYHLHSALLLWQERALDETVPTRRRQFMDVGTEVEDVGIPGRARRVGACRRAARVG